MRIFGALPAARWRPCSTLLGAHQRPLRSGGDDRGPAVDDAWACVHARVLPRGCARELRSTRPGTGGAGGRRRRGYAPDERQRDNRGGAAPSSTERGPVWSGRCPATASSAHATAPARFRPLRLSRPNRSRIPMSRRAALRHARRPVLASGFLSSVAALGVTVAVTTGARAEPPQTARTSSLGWIRTEGAEGCIGSRQLAERLGRGRCRADRRC